MLPQHYLLQHFCKRIHTQHTAASLRGHRQRLREVACAAAQVHY
jgi:hypothetical protein